MKLEEYAKHLLLSSSLEAKLTPPSGLEWPLGVRESIRLEKPGRPSYLTFSDKKNKIPRLEHLNQKSNRGISLHHFANHELMAIELFAWALLAFPEAPISVQKGFIKTIEEEQNHLKLYIDRMNDFGVQFGDFPVNYLFWKQIPRLKTLEQFTTVLSISFEGANLDFSQVYARAFAYFGDMQSSEIMLTVFEDEVKHVKRGLRIFQRSKPIELDEWEHYTSLIEFPFTPRRAKGYQFFSETRRLCGFSEGFIQKLAAYEDEYTSRVQAKSLDLFSISEEVWRKNRT